MGEDFKGLDDWMMTVTRGERQGHVPDKDLEDFHDEVMKKILERQRSGFGHPYAGFAVAAGISIAVIFSAILYIRLVPVEKPKPVAMEVTKQAAVSPIIPASVETVKAETLASQAKKAELPVFTEATLVDEIEALKELGAWTEDDEAEAGIPADVTFSDLEVGLQTSQSFMPTGSSVTS